MSPFHYSNRFLCFLRYWLYILMKEGVVDEEHPTFFIWLDSGHPLDFMFTQEKLNDWDEAHLMTCHWYIEMDPNCTPCHEEEHRKSVEPDNVRPQPAAAVEAPGKGCGLKAKIATGKTATSKETASKELLAKNPSAKASACALLVADALAKANDRPASLRSTTPNVADGGATTDKARPIRRKEQPGGKVFDQVEQSADLSLTNSVQITAPSILLSRDGPTSSIRSALKIRVSDDDDFEEHLMNTNGMNLHVPLASENFIRFVKMANG